MTEHSSDIMVSIVCDAYNHEKYIADALEGFLMQKTNLAFEILVKAIAPTWAVSSAAIRKQAFCSGSYPRAAL